MAARHDGSTGETAATGLHNLLEPRSLIAQFLNYPPYGFRPVDAGGGYPAFITGYDLTTTMEWEPTNRVGLALRRVLGRLLRFRTCFVGTTVSEYALLPSGLAPTEFAARITRDAADCSLVIIKDIPVAPVLVGAAAMDYSHALVEACVKAGYLIVEGQALAYVPLDFESTERFFARMPRTRRKDIKRKLRGASALDVQVMSTGAAMFDDDAVLNEFYTLYRNVYAQSTTHFDLLTPDFFRAVLSDPQNGGVVFTYRMEEGGPLIGYNLCFERDGMLLDKYVGFAYPQAREHNLYFVSWFKNLEYALQRGLKYYVAGWTDPEIKRHLGASFTLTQHAVYVRNPLLRSVLSYFKRYFEADARWLQRTR